MIGERIRAVRERKKLTQRDIEERSKLLRCYISRVENGHTVPAIETLEKFARAVEIPLYQLFYDGEEPPEFPNLLKHEIDDGEAWGLSGKYSHILNQFRKLLSRMDERDRKLLLCTAQEMARRKARHPSGTK